MPTSVLQYKLKLSRGQISYYQSIIFKILMFFGFPGIYSVRHT